jgi:hypothetical protein
LPTSEGCLGEEFGGAPLARGEIEDLVAQLGGEVGLPVLEGLGGPVEVLLEVHLGVRGSPARPVLR